jgi:hypothetical protein
MFAGFVAGEVAHDELDYPPVQVARGTTSRAVVQAELLAPALRVKIKFGEQTFLPADARMQA